MFKGLLQDLQLQREPSTLHHQSPSTPMMAPVIIMGALMMFVFWDTSDRH